jgi:gliding motility-associated transport system ATP-binding protein
MIVAERLSRYYGDHMAVGDLSFHVRKGEVMGLLGPNGAGKSTTLMMLTGFLPPSSGAATVADIPLDDSLSIRRRIGYLPENAPSYTELDVRSHLRFIGLMHGLPSGTLQERMVSVARLCGLEHVLSRRIDELSKGYRQRVGLAASMLHDPQCLILDEPTTGLDPNQIVEVRHLIRRIGEHKTVLLSSHVLSEVQAACDRIMIIDQGRLRAIGTPAELAGQMRGGSVLRLRFKGSAAKVMDLLQARLPDVTVRPVHADKPDTLILQHADPEAPLAESAFRAAIEADAVILEMIPEGATLEDVFRRMTGGQA